jgi:hypothetical protein
MQRDRVQQYFYPGMFSVTLELWLFGIHLEHISHGQLATQGGTEGDSSP